MRFVLFLVLRRVGLQVVSLVLILMLSAQVVHLSQKWHWLPHYTVFEAAETRYATLKSLWKHRPHLEDQSPFKGLTNNPQVKAPFYGRGSTKDEEDPSGMGLTLKKIKQLPLSQIQGQLQGLYVAEQDETAASHCLITVGGVGMTLSVGDFLQPGVVVTQITKEGVVLREHGKLTRIIAPFSSDMPVFG